MRTVLSHGTKDVDLIRLTEFIYHEDLREPNKNILIVKRHPIPSPPFDCEALHHGVTFYSVNTHDFDGIVSSSYTPVSIEPATTNLIKDLLSAVQPDEWYICELNNGAKL